MNVRVRFEDKGHRFVLVDGDAEDQQIELELQNTDQYKEANGDPTAGYNDIIEEYAAKGLRHGEITEQQARYITNKQVGQSIQGAESLHPANPKPQYKTHKRDEAGNMKDPVQIRSITVGCGTPVHSLSKLCSKAIEHLAPAHLPRMNQSTKAVLRRLIFIDENHTPLPPQAVFAFSDIKAMYPNVDIEEGLEEIKTKLEKDPSPLGISTDYIVEGL